MLQKLIPDWPTAQTLCLCTTMILVYDSSYIYPKLSNIITVTAFYVGICGCLFKCSIYRMFSLLNHAQIAIRPAELLTTWAIYRNASVNIEQDKEISVRLRVAVHPISLIQPLNRSAWAPRCPSSLRGVETGRACPEEKHVDCKFVRQCFPKWI